MNNFRMPIQSPFLDPLGGLYRRFESPFIDSARLLRNSPLFQLGNFGNISGRNSAFALREAFGNAGVFRDSQHFRQSLMPALDRLLNQQSFLLAEGFRSIEVAASLGATEGWLRWVEDPAERRKDVRRQRRGEAPAPLRPERIERLGESIVLPEAEVLTPDDLPGIILAPEQAGALEQAEFVPLRILQEIRANPDILFAVDPRRFEEIIADILHRLGHDVTLTPRSDDGGRDVIAAMKINGLPLAFYFECRRHKRTRAVKLTELRALLGVVAHDSRGVNKGILVTTSRFTKGGLKLIAEDLRLGGVDFKGILAWMDEVLG